MQIKLLKKITPDVELRFHCILAIDIVFTKVVQKPHMYIQLFPHAMSIIIQICLQHLLNHFKSITKDLKLLFKEKQLHVWHFIKFNVSFIYQKVFITIQD